MWCEAVSQQKYFLRNSENSNYFSSWFSIELSPFEWMRFFFSFFIFSFHHKLLQLFHWHWSTPESFGMIRKRKKIHSKVQLVINDTVTSLMYRFLLASIWPFVIIHIFQKTPIHTRTAHTVRHTWCSSVQSMLEMKLNASFAGSLATCNVSVRYEQTFPRLGSWRKWMQRKRRDAKKTRSIVRWQRSNTHCK